MCQPECFRDEYCTCYKAVYECPVYLLTYLLSDVDGVYLWGNQLPCQLSLAIHPWIGPLVSEVNTSCCSVVSQQRPMSHGHQKLAIETEHQHQFDSAKLSAKISVTIPQWTFLDMCLNIFL